MRISFTHGFLKKLDKIPEKIRERFEERLSIFVKNPFTPALNNHALHGELSGHWSINITWDWRAIFKKVREHDVCFVAIDTHSQLYKK